MSDFYEHKIGDLEDQIEELEKGLAQENVMYKLHNKSATEWHTKFSKAIKYLENLAETHRYNGGDAIMKFVKELKE